MDALATPFNGSPPPVTNPLVRSTCRALAGLKYLASNIASRPSRLYHCGHNEYRTPASTVIFGPAFQLSCAKKSNAVATHCVVGFEASSVPRWRKWLLPLRSVVVESSTKRRQSARSTATAEVGPTSDI